MKIATKTEFINITLSTKKQNAIQVLKTIDKISFKEFIEEALLLHAIIWLPFLIQVINFILSILFLLVIWFYVIPYKAWKSIRK